MAHHRDIDDKDVHGVPRISEATHDRPELAGFAGADADEDQVSRFPTCGFDQHPCDVQRLVANRVSGPRVTGGSKRLPLR
jgi:hypothetical protein